MCVRFFFIVLTTASLKGQPGRLSICSNYLLGLARKVA